jgi:hypothetical protein
MTFKNALGLTGVVAAVLLPVVLRRYFGTEIADAAVEEQAIALPLEDADEEPLHHVRSSTLHDARLVFLREDGQVDRSRV